MQENIEHASAPDTCHMNVKKRMREAALCWTAQTTLGRDWMEQLCTADMQTSKEHQLEKGRIQLTEGYSLHFHLCQNGGDASVPFPFLSKM